MKRHFKMIPAFDKRSTDPKKNYGIHGAELVMWVEGENGAVSFVLFTNWNLPSVQKETNIRKYPFEYCMTPTPADLGFHHKKPGEYLYKNDTCEFVSGHSCYYEGSGLQAEGIYKILLEKGSEGVYKKLESLYKKYMK